MFNKLLDFEVLKKVIVDEVENKKILFEKVCVEVIKMFDEIVVDVKYDSLCMVDCLLSWFWNKFY